MRYFYARKRLLDMFYQANVLFVKREMMNIENDTSERNLCSLLSRYIDDYMRDYGFNGYYVDVEYNRNGCEAKTIINGECKIIKIVCDLIVHSRGTKRKDNLIALEMKKLPCSQEDLESDRDRLMALTKHNMGEMFSWNGIELPRQVCDYEIGIYYIIDRTNRTITFEFYADGRLFKEEKYPFDYFFEKPLNKKVNYDEN